MVISRQDTGAFVRVVRSMRTPEEFTNAVSTAHLSIDLQSAAHGRSWVEQYQAKDWALDWSSSQVRARVRGRATPGWATFCLVRSDTPTFWWGRRSERGMLLCNPPGVPLDGFVNPGFSWLTVAIAPPLWEQVRQSTDHESTAWPAGVNVIHLPDPLLSELQATIASVREGLSRAVTRPETAAAAADQGRLLSLKITQLAGDHARSQPPVTGALAHRIRLARRAEEWMRANVNEDLCVPDICHAMRVSRRELEYAFEACFDSSPKAFLQSVRLNVVRQALRSAVPGRDSVSTIAVEHGINHLGRFALRYRQLFGELPSETLAKN